MKAFLLWILTAAALAAAVPGDPAPGWHFKTIDGRTVGPADFKGKVVLIDFWATWCGPCRHEMPTFAALQKQYGPEGLEILAVSIDGGPDPVRRYAEEHHLNFTVGMTNDQIYSAFGYPDVVPTSFLIDRKGVIRDRTLGESSRASWEKKILACLRSGS